MKFYKNIILATVLFISIFAFFFVYFENFTNAAGESPSAFKIKANNYIVNITLSKDLRVSPVHIFYNGITYSALIGEVTNPNATPIHIQINNHTYAFLSGTPYCRYWSVLATATNAHKFRRCKIGKSGIISPTPTPSVTTCQYWENEATATVRNKIDFCNIAQ